ncbi:MAG: hypothetical protein WC942_09850 [Clostridia bacterium]|jgi:hypothetical protein
MNSTLTKNQMIKKFKTFIEDGINKSITVEIRYDDQCNNGHNTFSITAIMSENGKITSGGCLHNEIIKHFPELKKYIKWHLCSSDGPLYYIENTLFWVKEKNWKNAKATAIWPKATIKQLSCEHLGYLLKTRKPALMEKFKKDIKSLGFIY